MELRLEELPDCYDELKNFFDNKLKNKNRKVAED